MLTSDPTVRAVFGGDRGLELELGERVCGAASPTCFVGGSRCLVDADILALSGPPFQRTPDTRCCPGPRRLRFTAGARAERCRFAAVMSVAVHDGQTTIAWQVRDLSAVP